MSKKSKPSTLKKVMDFVTLSQQARHFILYLMGSTICLAVFILALPNYNVVTVLNIIGTSAALLWRDYSRTRTKKEHEEELRKIKLRLQYEYFSNLLNNAKIVHATGNKTAFKIIISILLRELRKLISYLDEIDQVNLRHLLKTLNTINPEDKYFSIQLTETEDMLQSLFEIMNAKEKEEE